MKRAVVIGLGSPILTDDSVGLCVARAFYEAGHALTADADVKELHAGGLGLVEAMDGYDCAIVVDAMKTGARPGEIRVLREAEFGACVNSGSAHDMNLAGALKTGRMLGLSLPASIRLFGIEAFDAETFGETLTPDVAAAVPIAVRMILKELSAYRIRKS